MEGGGERGGEKKRNRNENEECDGFEWRGRAERGRQKGE